VAGLLLILIGLAGLALSIWFYPLSPLAIDPEQGEHVFMARCASCHALRAGDSTGYGPSLYRVGAWSAGRVAGQSSEEYILTSIVRPSAYRAPQSTNIMPENVARTMSRAEILSVAAFLGEQGAEVNYRRLFHLGEQFIESVEVRRAVAVVELSSVERGRELYLGRLGCVDCHPLDGFPGHDLLAPGLLSIGSHDRAYLEDSILRPNSHITPGYHTYLVVSHGLPVSGRKLPAGPDSLRLLVPATDGTPSVRTFRRAELDQPEEPSTVSRMSGLDRQLADGDLKALVDFLLTLR
jgi:mono/diheme cytochrome c family protein